MCRKAKTNMLSVSTGDVVPLIQLYDYSPPNHVHNAMSNSAAASRKFVTVDGGGIILSQMGAYEKGRRVVK